MSGRILALHFDYVDGYTNPLLFLFERNHDYPADDQRLLGSLVAPLSGRVKSSFGLIGEGPK